MRCFCIEQELFTGVMSAIYFFETKKLSLKTNTKSVVVNLCNYFYAPAVAIDEVMQQLTQPGTTLRRDK